MSNAASPDNLGFAFFQAHQTNVYGDTSIVVAENWSSELDDVDRQEWIEAAQDFCKYLKHVDFNS